MRGNTDVLVDVDRIWFVKAGDAIPRTIRVFHAIGHNRTDATPGCPKYIQRLHAAADKAPLSDSNGLPLYGTFKDQRKIDGDWPKQQAGRHHATSGDRGSDCDTAESESDGEGYASSAYSAEYSDGESAMSEPWDASDCEDEDTEIRELSPEELLNCRRSSRAIIMAQLRAAKQLSDIQKQAESRDLAEWTKLTLAFKKMTLGPKNAIAISSSKTADGLAVHTNVQAVPASASGSHPISMISRADGRNAAKKAAGISARSSYLLLGDAVWHEAARPRKVRRIYGQMQKSAKPILRGMMDAVVEHDALQIQRSLRDVGNQEASIYRQRGPHRLPCARTHAPSVTPSESRSTDSGINVNGKRTLESVVEADGSRLVKQLRYVGRLYMALCLDDGDDDDV